MTAVSMMQHRKMSYLKKTVVLLLDDDDIDDDFVYIKNTKTVELWWITHLMISRENFLTCKGKKRKIMHLQGSVHCLILGKMLQKVFDMHRRRMIFLNDKKTYVSKRIKYGLYVIKRNRANCIEKCSIMTS